jgi:hypothetical protein|tara:strand:- start:996 stop:1220 length:225 start_codon:yes stop_codon:yes gene_type:complete
VKLSKLKFVDGKRYKRGVDMDVNMQLLTLALRPGRKPDSKLIAEAVDDAGYLAVEWYTMKAGKLKAHPFPVPKR